MIGVTVPPTKEKTQRIRMQTQQILICLSCYHK